MGFGINGHDLPSIRSYKQAKSRYDSIKPVRGTNNVRPLGDRRKQHQRIEEARPNFSGAAGMACVLYHTQCVTYYEDGTIHLAHGGYISQSTCKFIERIAPVTSVRMDKQRGCLVVRVAGGEYKCGKDGLWLRRPTADEPPQVAHIPIDPVPFKVTTVNRTAMREMKKQHAAFMQYTIGLCKLTQWEKPDQKYQLLTVRQLETHSHDTLDIMRGDDLEKWAELYPVFVRAAGSSFTSYDYTAGRWLEHWVGNEKRLTDRLTHLIKQVHAKDVLVREALPLGEHKKDPNHKYVQYMREV